jgi:hypothetical protein
MKFICRLIVVTSENFTSLIKSNRCSINTVGNICRARISDIPSLSFAGFAQDDSHDSYVISTPNSTTVGIFHFRTYTSGTSDQLVHNLMTSRIAFQVNTVQPGKEFNQSSKLMITPNSQFRFHIS